MQEEKKNEMQIPKCRQICFDSNGFLCGPVFIAMEPQSGFESCTGEEPFFLLHTAVCFFIPFKGFCKQIIKRFDIFCCFVHFGLLCYFMFPYCIL